MSEVVSSRQENSRMLWIQLLAGPILWSVHFLLVYMLAETYCQAGWNFSLLGLNGISFLVILLTILAVIATVLFGLRSYRGWRSFHTDRSLSDQFRESSAWFQGPIDFFYFTGFLLSTLFALVILFVGLPVIFLEPC